MKLPDPTTLRMQRDELSRRLAERLAEQGPMDELQDMRSRLQLLDEAIETSAPHRSALRHHISALLLVASVVSIAALWPMPRVSFALELEASAAQMQMPRAGTLEGDVVDGELRAEGFSKLDSADGTLARHAADSGAGQLDLHAQRLRLRRIRYPAGARLHVEAGPRMVRLGIEGAPHTIEIEFGGDAALSVGGEPREHRRVDNAEWLHLVSDKAPTELWLEIAPARRLQWRGLQPQSLRFVERQAGAEGQAQFVSSLQRGHLRLPATEREFSLAAGSGLVLDGLQLEQAELMLGDRVAWKISGSAREIAVETAGVRRLMSPSVLEVAAHNHTLELLWSAAGLLWGISTWLRKAFGNAA